MLKKKFNDKLIVLLFVICAIGFVAYPMHSGYIFSGSDMQFHLSRIYELRNGLKHFAYPWVSFATFNKIGYAINSFYPNGTLLIFIPLFILIKNPVVAYYTFMGILFFLGEIISYLSYLSLAKSRTKALLFTTLYMTSGYMLFVYWYAFELGEILAFIMLPLWIMALLSWKDNSPVSGVLENNKILFLIISLVWITYSHVLTALCCVLITGVYLVCLFIFSKCKRKFVHDMLISGLIYCLASSFFIVSLLMLFFKEKVIGPDRWFSISNFKSLILNSLDSPINPGNSLPVDQSATLGLLIVVSFGILLIIICGGGQDHLTKNFVLAGMFFLILSTSLFPWQLIVTRFTFITHFQYSFRFLIFAILFISLAVPRGLAFSSKSVLIVVALSSLIYTGQIKHFVDRSLKTQHIVNYLPTRAQGIGYANFYVDRSTYTNLFDGFYTAFGGPTDYLTAQQRRSYVSLAEHQVLQKNKIVRSVNSYSTNYAKFKITKPINGKIDIPVLKTNNRYIVKDNGERVSIKSSGRGSIELNLKKQGTHTITVTVKPLNSVMLAAYISIFVCLLLIFLYIKALINLRRAKKVSKT